MHSIHQVICWMKITRSVLYSTKKHGGVLIRAGALIRMNTVNINVW